MAELKSYNGWPASKSAAAIDIDPGFTAAGRKFPGGVKRGPVSVVLRYVIEQFDKRVEAVDLYDPGDEWGYHYKPSANSPRLISCHSSGTAVDINATRHPNGTDPGKTFTIGQIAEIRKILAEVDGVVKWLGFAKTPDPMHFEIAADAAEVARVAGRLLSTVPPTPPPTKEAHKVLYIIRAENDVAHWLTDMVTKRHLVSKDDLDRQQYIAKGHPERYHEGGQVLVWPKANVDAIPTAG